MIVLIAGVPKGKPPLLIETNQPAQLLTLLVSEKCAKNRQNTLFEHVLSRFYGTDLAHLRFHICDFSSRKHFIEIG